MGKKRKKVLPRPVVPDTKKANALQSLYTIAKKRTGGAVNVRGIGYQFLYSIWLILEHLTGTNKTITIRLEGIEDIDLHLDSENRYLQIKTSKNSIDAATLWSLGVLQNFLIVHKVDKLSKFTLVHDTSLAKGNLDFIKGHPLTEKTLNHWFNKFREADLINNIDELKEFLSKVNSDHKEENKLYDMIVAKLIRHYNIRGGTELNYLKALFYHVYDWAKKRETISQQDLIKLIQTITDSYSVFPINQAIQNEWINKLTYSVNDNYLDSGYYDGKAARPTDIANGLNARRPVWESQIQNGMSEHDVIIIKSSSGQGKSTLAYQAGMTATEVGKSVYNINFCPEHDQAIAIADFILSRIKIGEEPILIIDGLSTKNAAWPEIVDRLRETIVKTIITTREEDWTRYSAVTTASAKEINISLSIDEAKEIYNYLKANGKVNASVQTWQPEWERVKDKGLLIEYVFLLTQGQMIQDRLSEQVRLLHNEPDGSVKLEILRMIAVADVLNIRLKTQGVTKFIQETIKFTTDRNEVYRQLEHEYYIKFDKEYVEGLHPVRSMHLVKLLHSNIDETETLLALLDIIEEGSVYDYFMNVLLTFPSIKVYDFCTEAARKMSNRPITDMVYAIDGIMHSEPVAYWKANLPVFDEAHSTGGLVLFISEAIPFNNVKVLKNLADNMSDELGDNMRRLVTLAGQLSKYSPEQSSAYQFTRQLGVELSKKTEFPSLEGIAFLIKWFKRFELEVPKLISDTEIDLMDILEKNDIREAVEIFQYSNMTDPKSYKTFIKDNFKEIVGWLKRKTNTLSMFVEGNDLHMEYILDSKDAERANELSVYRIDIAHAFFPQFDRYCTLPVILPFPNEDYYKVVVANGTKHIPKENLHDSFDVHINQIWAKSIEARYAASTAYEWQAEHYKTRLLLLESARSCIRFLEAVLENNSSRQRSSIHQFSNSANNFLDAQRVLKRFPSDGKKYFEKAKFSPEESIINNVFSSFRNFYNQVTGLLSGEFRLPVYNLNSAVDNLIHFQSAFEKVASATYQYFDTTQLIKEETSIYTRLVKTVRFYQYHKSLEVSDTIVLARNEVEKWWVSNQENQLKALKSILLNMEQQSHFKFVAPNGIDEHESIRSVSIGVTNCTPGANDDFFLLSAIATELMSTDIQFFTFFFIEDGKTSLGWRLSREYFQKFLDFDNDVVSEDNWSVPIPVYPTPEMIAVLPDITVNSIEAQKEDEEFFNMMFKVWHLLEFRKRLNQDSIVEAAWLEELEEQYNKEITVTLNEESQKKSIGFLEVSASIKNFLMGSNITQEHIIELMTSRAISNAQNT